MSFVHRVLFQWACKATIGKLLLGVVLVRADNRRRPTLRRLAALWLFGTLMSVLEGVLNGL